MKRVLRLVVVASLVVLAVGLAFGQRATSPFEAKPKAAEAQEPRLYVSLGFDGYLVGDADAEAIVAWDEFVAKVNKDLGTTMASTFRPRNRKTPNDSINGVLGTAHLTMGQFATLHAAMNALLGQPCFSTGLFTTRVSRDETEPIQARKVYVPPVPIIKGRRQTQP